MTPLQLLTKMEVLLTPPEAWIKGKFALNHNGYLVPPDAPSAVCWCLDGARRKLAGTSAPESAEVSIALSVAVGDSYETYMHMNDAPETDHSDILQLIARAKELVA